MGEAQTSGCSLREDAMAWQSRVCGDMGTVSERPLGLWGKEHHQ